MDECIGAGLVLATLMIRNGTYMHHDACDCIVTSIILLLTAKTIIIDYELSHTLVATH